MRYELLHYFRAADGQMRAGIQQMGRDRGYAERCLANFDRTKQPGESFTLRQVEEPSDQPALTWDDDE